MSSFQDTESSIPEEHLRIALRAKTPEARLEAAQAGLEFPKEQLDADTEVLLLRQVYTAHVERRRYDEAIVIAEVMSKIGPLSDIAFHDKSRAELAAGDLSAAIGSARLAARRAIGDRKSFMFWSLAILQHWDGQVDAAIESIGKGLRYATGDRALLKAYEAYVRLAADEVPEDLEVVRAALRRSPAAKGYGAFVLGMIAYHLGDNVEAVTQLRAFVRRNARLDFMKALTLERELAVARQSLATLVSS